MYMFAVRHLILLPIAKDRKSIAVEFSTQVLDSSTMKTRKLMGTHCQ
jgi:hypothetical protein